MVNQDFADVNINNNFLNSKKLNIETFVKSSNEVLIIPENINLSYFDEVNVTIKNIKTRDEYLCPFKIENNSFVIDLSSISYLFTDYEGSIFINLRKENLMYTLKPVIKKSTVLKKKLDTMNKGSYQWFIRILDNGEILFSSIMKTEK